MYFTLIDSVDFFIVSIFFPRTNQAASKRINVWS